MHLRLLFKGRVLLHGIFYDIRHNMHLELLFEGRVYLHGTRHMTGVKQHMSQYTMSYDMLKTPQAPYVAVGFTRFYHRRTGCRGL